MKNIIFKGCATAIVTPFDEENKINFDEFRRLVNFQIDNGVNAIVVCGTTGEAATLSNEEKNALIEYCVKVVNKRVPVIAGVGGNNTESVIKNTKFSEKIGVNGLLAVTPYYNKTTQKGIIEHFKIIAENTNLPIILYNVPSRTGMDILPTTYLELSKIENIVATKEASGDISKTLKIRNLCKDDLNVYSGNDEQIIPVLSLGGIGVISVLSNIMPKFTSEMIKKYFNQEIDEATNMQIEVSNLIDSLFKEVNPIPVKEALNIMGFRCGNPRLPLVKCSIELSEEIENE
jgi:4-hydroxy-tetrahydrodipicolinate synthase